jgi:hypothetical protein
MISRVIVTEMDVYLVPTGSDRFELYCEPAEDPAPPALDGGSGPWRWLQARFNAVLEAVEHERDDQRPADGVPAKPAGPITRLRVRFFRWFAERIAEQRLLWRLRGQSGVRTFFPANLDGTRALEMIREHLRGDLNRHRRWIAADTLALLFSLLLTPLPGPNLPGYYFTFRVVGHFLSVRGARHGLDAVVWEMQPSAPLTELAELDHLSTAERETRIRAIADQLGLPRLARFVERTAVETA